MKRLTLLAIAGTAIWFGGRESGKRAALNTPVASATIESVDTKSTTAEAKSAIALDRRVEASSQSERFSDVVKTAADKSNAVAIVGDTNNDGLNLEPWVNDESNAENSLENRDSVESLRQLSKKLKKSNDVAVTKNAAKEVRSQQVSATYRNILNKIGKSDEGSARK